MPTSIEILDLSGNKFTDGIPSEWGLLTKLKNLKVFDCGLDGACVCRDVHGCARCTENVMSLGQQGFCVLGPNFASLILNIFAFAATRAAAPSCRCH